MKEPVCQRIAKTSMQIEGFLGDYLRKVTDQWLLVAPKANPGMLEMFRDRDASPLRQMVPWAGEFAGKYLTGAVQILRVTGDARLRSWLEQFVRILIGFQDADGYLGPWPQGCRLTNADSAGERTWDTWGHYHVMLGLMLWHEETGDEDALACASRIADLLCRIYLGPASTRLVDTGSTEMNLAPAHALCMLHRRTWEERYLDLALQIVDEFGAAADGKPLAGDYLEQALQGREFFQTPKPRWESLHPIMALAELHWTTGEDRYRQAFEQIWWSIAKLDRHNNGGFSSGEKATGNPYHLAPIESCCTIAWMALSVEMLKLTGNSLVADELELSLFNSVVGMHSSTGRWATYDTPMNGVRRASAHAIVFQAREGTPELNCCSVNTPRGFGMLSDWALLQDQDGLLLNYYGPGVLEAQVGPDLTVALAQDTDYPLAGQIDIVATPSRPASFALKLRIPHWSKRISVAVNGKPLAGVIPGTYLKITREWHPGDRISMALDMSCRIWRGEKECAGLASVYCGPLLLAYDHRYNLDRTTETVQVRDIQSWDPTRCMLAIPAIDAADLEPRPGKWDEWLPPLLLLEFSATDGKPVRLVDFGSAGETGTPYCSWIPIENAPSAQPFSRENPLRTQQTGVRR